MSPLRRWFQCSGAVLSIGAFACADPTLDAVATEDALSADLPYAGTPQGKPTTYPIVLVHGFLASAKGMSSFRPEITAGLQDDGHRVFKVAVNPLGTVATRAVALRAQVLAILKQTGASKVNIIAHSMGGLDARYLISMLHEGHHVASLTTLGTPHRGTTLADAVLSTQGTWASDRAFDALSGLAEQLWHSKEVPEVKAAVADLTVDAAKTFNAAVKDDAGVYYQSWAGVSSSLFWQGNANDASACVANDGRSLLWARAGTFDVLAAPLMATNLFVAPKGEPSDGATTVASAKWGNFRGCVPADHLDLIGPSLGRGTRDRGTGFDFSIFARKVAFDLQKRGF
jgi:triacylglycerol lipase